MGKERGVVNTWNVEKQFGFVSINSGKPDAFLHSENIRDRDLRDEVKVKGMRRGDKIRFDLETPETGRGKMVAVNIELEDGGYRGRGGGRGRSSPSRSRSHRRRSPSPRRRRSPSLRRRNSRRRGRSGSRSQSRSRSLNRRRRSDSRGGRR
eukprot:TRINITY_DN53473_c0_g1_i1.p1 TRINITY_DN53473_c0_g1~~TRINITY_DN53473_c0_g1_i1.p1  ORF type:complete len:151 (+),score=15.37 TRINITY_DN53473_c0_g1_i1:149-601(+)